MYKLCFIVPETHLDSVKQAVFDAGGGTMGDYDSCCWQVKGCGQFRPLPGSSPFIGKVNELESVDEYRVELVCEDACMAAVVAALKQAHPYEEAAYDVIRLADF